MSTSRYSSTGYKTDTSVTQQHAYASPHDATGFISTAAPNIKRSNLTLLAGTANVSTSASNAPTSSNNTVKASSGFVRRKKSEQDVDDDMLFDFLNSSDPPSGDRKDLRREPLKVAVPEVTEVQSTPAVPPLSAAAPLHSLPSAPSTPPSTRGISRASSLSSLSTHSMKISDDGSGKEQSHGMNVLWLLDFN